MIQLKREGTVVAEDRLQQRGEKGGGRDLLKRLFLGHTEDGSGKKANKEMAVGCSAGSEPQRFRPHRKEKYRRSFNGGQKTRKKVPTSSREDKRESTLTRLDRG